MARSRQVDEIGRKNPKSNVEAEHYKLRDAIPLSEYKPSLLTGASGKAPSPDLFSPSPRESLCDGHPCQECGPLANTWKPIHGIMKLTCSFASISALLLARRLSVSNRSSSGSARIPSGMLAASL